MSQISKALSQLHPTLLQEIESVAVTREIPQDTQILRAGQFVKVIPVVLDGLIRVFTRHEDRELLLYYIQPSESCILSFAAGVNNAPIDVYAVTEENTRALLLPVDHVSQWTCQFPDFNLMFYGMFSQRYGELLDTVHHVLFNKLDKRVYDYMTTKSRLTGRNPIRISHRQIANELGTVREVVSRIIKKLENEGKVRQHTSSIEILNM